MKFSEISESTTSGSVATVASPMGSVQKRGGNLLSGKKTNKKYANSVDARKQVKQVKESSHEDRRLKRRFPGFEDGGSNYVLHYEDDRGVEHEVPFALSADGYRTVDDFLVDFQHDHPSAVIQGVESQMSETAISEQDLIVVPSQAHRLKSGFVSHDEDRRNHEVEMALSDLFQCAKNAKTVYHLLKHVPEEVGIEGWVQEKIIKANDYLNAICEYLEHKASTDKSVGGIGEGRRGRKSADYHIWKNILDNKDKFVVRATKGRVGNELIGSYDTIEDAREVAKQYPDAKIFKNLSGEEVSEAKKSKVKNPHAVGMAQAMKTTGDKPPLEKSTIKKAHKIAKSIKD